MAGYAVPHSTHRNTIAGGLCKRSFDDWQRTAFKSVVRAPDSSFSQGLQGLTAVAEKSTNIFARHGRGQEPDGGYGKVRLVHAFRPGFGAVDFAAAQLCARRTIVVHQPRNTQREMDYFLEKAFRRSESRTMRLAQIQIHPSDDIRGTGSVERRKHSVAGIGMVL